MYKNSNIPSNNTTLWQYLGTKHLDFRRENNSTPGVLIKKILYIHTHSMVYIYTLCYVYM